MGDDNRELLNELIRQTLEYVKEHPEDTEQNEKLEMYMKAASDQYKVAMEAYNTETKNVNDREIEERKLELQEKELEQAKRRNVNDREIEERKLELQEKELEQAKRRDRGDFIAKLSGTAAATATAILAIKWESVGEFVHGIALKIGPKFHS